MGIADVLATIVDAKLTALNCQNETNYKCEYILYVFVH